MLHVLFHFRLIFRVTLIEIGINFIAARVMALDSRKNFVCFYPALRYCNASNCSHFNIYDDIMSCSAEFSRTFSPDLHAKKILYPRLRGSVSS